MASPSHLEALPTPQLLHTPGAYPPSPGEAEESIAVSSHFSLSHALDKRRAEYTRSQQIRIKVGTWNVASVAGTEKDIGGWFIGSKGLSEQLSVLSLENETDVEAPGDVEDVGTQEARRDKKLSTLPKNEHNDLPAGREIGLYVLGLQEIVDVSSPAEALRPYNDPHPGRKWKQAVEAALPDGYVKVAEQQLVGLFLLIYAAPSIAPTISSVSTASVPTGFMGYMGNKGAVSARIVLGETTRLTFVNCHLAAGTEKGNLERRNWDASQVLSRTKFDSVDGGDGTEEEIGEGIGDEDFAFWFGDLNYRLETLPGDDVRRLLMVHTTKEYEPGQPSKRKIEAELATHSHDSLVPPSEEDFTGDKSSYEFAPVGSSSFTLENPQDTDPMSNPASLQTTISSLLRHDQLSHQIKQKKAFHDGWREGPITFLPTYKYDIGSVGMFDSSEKKRGPSWCDRILFRTRQDRLDYEKKASDEAASKRRDEEMKSHGIDDNTVTDEEILFDYDPENDGANETYNENEAKDPEAVTTDAGFEDKIHQEYYTSHQRVLSSDHKPLDAVFALTYDAVDPGLKAKVHQEIVRVLDKAENEGRPSVAVVVDHHLDSKENATFDGVDFGEVCFDDPKSRTITIANTGGVLATIGFADRDQPGTVAPPWLNIHFDRPTDFLSDNDYTLTPGDAANVELTVNVSSIPLVRDLNAGTTSLDDVLVLRVHNGRDYFLSLRAKWQASAFGHSIERLIRVPEGGVRKLQQRSSTFSSNLNLEAPAKWSTPREIFRLAEAIEECLARAVADYGMRGTTPPPWVQNPSWPFSVDESDYSSAKKAELSSLRESIREALDTDTAFSNTMLAAAGEVQKAEALGPTLIAFLESIEDGVITHSLWLDLERGIVEREKGKKVLSNEEERTWILDTL
ncbi:MAG: hypothetical protein Q9190_003576, partial [Brigantiaea leucoxantha]